MDKHELTAGLEVHQQLDTGKLFCNCPSDIRDDEPDFSVERVLRASAGESGETDIAAKHEQHKAKRFVYQGYADTTCLIEIDEEPVSKANSKALSVALQVAKMLNLTIMDEVHVMRKTVVDGSNTSGFQRTALIGLNGEVTVSGKKIRIEQLCLEEDACKIVKRDKQHDIYNVSRLGIPLLEITTGPDLHSPEQVKEVAAYLGMLLRSTEQVKRGIGTIRQDVNVSVPGGTRVELKGAQDLDSLGLLVQNEAQRQRALITLTQVIAKQDYLPHEVTAAFNDTKAGFIASSIKKGEKAVALRLKDWKESLAAELMPGVRLGKELAGYAKAQGFGGLIHSAEDFSKYAFSEEPKKIRELLGCDSDDAWLVMIGEQSKLVTFFEHVLIPRLHQLSVGVPKEVRKAEVDGSNTYLRPMPGAARLYPETDVRPIAPDTTNIHTPELIEEKTKRLQKQYNISADLASQISKEGFSGVYESWVRAYPQTSSSTLATLLVSKEKEIKTRHGIDIDIVELGPLFLDKLNAGELSLASIEDVLVKLAKREAVDFAAFKPVDDAEIKRVVQELIRDNPGASQGLLMGKVMRHFNNKVDGKKVQQLLSELMQ